MKRITAIQMFDDSIVVSCIFFNETHSQYESKYKYYQQPKARNFRTSTQTYIHSHMKQRFSPHRSSCVFFMFQFSRIPCSCFLFFLFLCSCTIFSKQSKLNFDVALLFMILPLERVSTFCLFRRNNESKSHFTNEQTNFKC